MTTYTVVAKDYRHHALPLREWSAAAVVGLRYPEKLLKAWPELGADSDVKISPGMNYSLNDETDVWQALYSEHYDLLQVDAGGELKDNDEFEVKPFGWKFVVSGVHVLPCNPPAEIFEEHLRRSEARHEREMARWG